MTLSDRSDYRFAKLPTADLLLSAAAVPGIDAAKIASQNRIEPVIVIDTNVWLDLFYWHDPDCKELANCIKNRVVVPCITLACLEELADVLSRTHFALSISQQQDLLAQVMTVCKLVAPPEASIVKCRDADDQKFLDLAQAIRANFLVTKDKLVLKAGKRLKKFGICVLAPGDQI